MTTIHHSPPPGAAPFAIYEDPEDQEPPSPSDVYEGDVSFHSEVSLPGADEAVPSIENEHEPIDEPEPYISSYTSRPSILSTSQSRRVSAITSTSFISSIPSEISISSKPILPANNVDSRYAPRKDRPPFRNPSSVRAMQMSSPPPLPALEATRERMKGSYKLTTPSRSGRSDTVSTNGSRRRSRSHRESFQGEQQPPQSPRPTPTPQQHLPLVLLHVTILPMQLPYAHELMIKVMPEWLVENYRVLGEKLQDIVLMRRGVLIPHPRDEYDVLEERILESLELKTPRLLKCGHFVGPDSDTDEQEDEVEGGSVTDNATGRGSRMSGGTITAEDEGEWEYPTLESDDASVCTDCHRQVKKPGKGVGSGTKRWDVRIYAANGLMRAGAWSAAWSEMERCDVEIAPWIPEDVRKALDKRVEEEQEAAERKRMYAAELQRQIEEEAARQRILEDEAEAIRMAEELVLQRRAEDEAAALQRRLEEEASERTRLEETMNEKIEEAKEMIRLEFEAQALAEANSVAERLRAMESALKKEQEKDTIQTHPVLYVPHVQQHPRSRSRGRRPRSPSRRPNMDEIPIGTLLGNYFLLLLRDSRNFFIIILSALVIFLAMNANPNWNLNFQSSDLATGLLVDDLVDTISPIVITSTATMTATATSVSVLTITETQAVINTPEAHLPLPSETLSDIGSLTSQNVAEESSTESPLLLSQDNAIVASEDALSHTASSQDPPDTIEALAASVTETSPAVSLSEEAISSISSPSTSVVSDEIPNVTLVRGLDHVLESTLPTSKALEEEKILESEHPDESDSEAQLGRTEKDEL